jgi:hypothetical protein
MINRDDFLMLNGLLAGAERAKQQLQLAASIQDVNYNASNGSLTLKVQNQTGHKLISGFPEGRRMFVNIKAYSGGSLIYEVNPYDAAVGTLKGLPSEYSPSSPSLGANEQHVDALVYETHPTSALPVTLCIMTRRAKHSWLLMSG